MHKRFPGESIVEYLGRIEQEVVSGLIGRVKALHPIIEQPASLVPRRRNFSASYALCDELRRQQNDRCYWCCRPLVGLGRKRIHVDHVQPYSRGGSHHRSNLRVSCAPCNLAKHAQHPLDFALKLLSEWSPVDDTMIMYRCQEIRHS